MPSLSRPERRSLLGAVVLSIVAFVVRAAGADWTVAEERWFELTLGGKPCGSMHTLEERDGERVRSTRALQMRLARGDTNVAVSTQSVFVETARGEPIEAVLRQDLGGSPAETTVRFERDGTGQGKAWKATIKDGAGTREKVLPDDGWLTPAATERYVLERLKAGAREIRYRSIDVETGLEISAVEMKRIGTGQAAIDHEATPRMIQVGVWSVVDSIQKLETTERFAQDGVLVESAAKLGIGELKTRLTSKERAIEASQRTGVEIMVTSFVPAKRRIFDVMELPSLRLKVTTKEGELPDLPEAGAQRVRRIAPNEAEVEIVTARGSAPVGDEATSKAYLGRTQLIDGGSQEVQSLLERTLPKDRTLPPRERAEALRAAAGKALPNKNLSSPFASASEALRVRGGDCSEHAVLLAALLREAGIPARVAAGLIYADRFAGERNVWAWHVWTQALVPAAKGEGLEWVDYDATLPVRFHAAHLCVAVGALDAGATDPMWTSTLSMIGNLSILDLRDDGRGDGTEAPRTKDETGGARGSGKDSGQSPGQNPGQTPTSHPANGGATP